MEDVLIISPSLSSLPYLKLTSLLLNQKLEGIPALVPGLLPVQDEEEVLQFGQAKLIPQNLARIILLYT